MSTIGKLIRRYVAHVAGPESAYPKRAIEQVNLALAEMGKPQPMAGITHYPKPEVNDDPSDLRAA